MAQDRTGQVAVLFVSQRSDADATGYAQAAATMDALAATQPGYAGVESVRGSGGIGITISYWTDEAAAIAWRNHPDHARIREQGRERWYDWYAVQVVEVTRSYGWRREGVS
jgi:heme-degrading monooxygenase HmoA